MLGLSTHPQQVTQTDDSNKQKKTQEEEEEQRGPVAPPLHLRDSDVKFIFE